MGMYQIILFIHVFAAVFIIALVLVQQGKGASVGAAFGSGASQTVFGSRGSGSFLFRVTISFITVFFITSITLNTLTMHSFKQQKMISLPVIPVQKSSSKGKSSPIKPLSTPAAPVLPSEIPGRK